MAKKYSLKFWISFWLVSVILLAGFWFFLEARKKPAETVSSLIDYVPWLSNKEELKTVAYFANYLLRHDGQEKTFLILFQNNMELRPGGGYIGSFGILKVKDGKMEELQTHDLSNFDGRIPDTFEPPYPMKSTLNIKSWKLRDSNWSPDFAKNAEQAEFFYKIGQGQENFNGIVAINTDVLASFLKVTGPISIPGYPDTYDSENAILALEYQVEKGYAEQGVELGERKSIVSDLAKIVAEKAFQLSVLKKIELAQVVLEDLERKDIQLNFKDENLQAQARQAGWGGEVDENWKKDFLMVVDANLGSYKSDYYIQRKFDYKIDLSGEKPKVNLKITYTHTGKVKDWMTRDYLSYTRVYVPAGAWLENSQGWGEVRYGDDLNKKFFGSIVKVPLDSTRTVELNYTLSEDLNLKDFYNLLIQKQSGAGEIPVHLTIIDRNHQETVQDFVLDKDWQLEK